MPTGTNMSVQIASFLCTKKHLVAANERLKHAPVLPCDVPLIVKDEKSLQEISTIYGDIEGQRYISQITMEEIYGFTVLGISKQSIKVFSETDLRVLFMKDPILLNQFLKPYNLNTNQLFKLTDVTNKTTPPTLTVEKINISIETDFEKKMNDYKNQMGQLTSFLTGALKVFSEGRPTMISTGLGTLTGLLIDYYEPTNMNEAIRYLRYIPLFFCFVPTSIMGLGFGLGPGGFKPLGCLMASTAMGRTIGSKTGYKVAFTSISTLSLALDKVINESVDNDLSALSKVFPLLGFFMLGIFLGQSEKKNEFMCEILVGFLSAAFTAGFIYQGRYNKSPRNPSEKNFVKTDVTNTVKKKMEFLDGKNTYLQFLDGND